MLVKKLETAAFLAVLKIFLHCTYKSFDYISKMLQTVNTQLRLLQK